MKINVSYSCETDNFAFLCAMRKESNTFYHCYQRPKDRGVIFYTVIDYLLYFTIFCTVAPRYGVIVVKLVQMLDHLHHAIIEKVFGQLGAFLDNVTSVFVREYNKAYNRKGPMFDTPFGRAPKNTDKKIRTNLTYLDNNPVERRLVVSAEEYRWNYLAYAVSDHPFSEKIVLRKASMPLRRALKMVKARHAKGRYLTIPMLRRMFDSLPSSLECEQLTDFIISTYSVIDYDAALRYFKTYQDELITAHANTGSEYDINETFIGRSDACYVKMTRALLKSGIVEDIHEVYTMTKEKKMQAFRYLMARIDAPRNQIAAFLHLELV